MRLQKTQIMTERKFLKVLDISGCNSLTDSNIKKVTEVFANLEVGKNKSVARNLKQLQHEDISCPLMTPAGLYTIHKHCPQLVQVTIGSAHHPPAILSHLQEKGLMVKQVYSCAVKYGQTVPDPCTVLGQEMDGQGEEEGWLGMVRWGGL